MSINGWRAMLIALAIMLTIYSGLYLAYEHGHAGEAIVTAGVK